MLYAIHESQRDVLEAGHARWLAAGPQAAMASDRRRGPTYTVERRVAMIPVTGVITYRDDWISWAFGGTTVTMLQQQLREAAADPTVDAILMHFHSPGGGVFGLPELAAQMREIRVRKPIICLADPLVASAALWIATQGSELYAIPSALVGSLGVFILHADFSGALAKAGVKMRFIYAGKHKVEGNDLEPLTAEAAAAMQAEVDHVYDQFVADVAAGRRLAQSVVRRDFGQGRLLNTNDALAVGMINRIATIEETHALALDYVGRLSERRNHLRDAALLQEIDFGAGVDKFLRVTATGVPFTLPTASEEREAYELEELKSNLARWEREDRQHTGW